MTPRADSNSHTAGVTLTPFERKALIVLANQKRMDGLPPSAVGHCIWEQTENGKRHPSAQGLALFASRFLSMLRKRELAYQGRAGWNITAAGRAALAAANVD